MESRFMPAEVSPLALREAAPRTVYGYPAQPCAINNRYGTNMRIYRIEHSTGWGPEASGTLAAHVLAAGAAIAEGSEPPPANDEEHILDAEARDRRLVFPSTMMHYQSFGCKSLATLRRWFPSPAGTKALEELDATLCAFEARDEDVIAAPSQVLFNRLTATFLWNVPASMLHTLTDEEAVRMPRKDRIFLEPNIQLSAPIVPIPAAAA
ncbi:hypothetical protein [Aquamicrobium ahrensii]|uniref:Uncharacterized protein n=1 Tax=Aquamicrobium ahrensii TaxID=469551 RepID=A0ABV2KME3_9HYPH